MRTHQKFLALLLGAVLLAPVAAAAQAPDAKGPRILSIGGDVTETLYALGLDASIVAVDTTSVYPPRALREKANVGYMRALSSEGVLSVGAGLIIASDKAGPPDVVKALKAAGPYVEIVESNDADAVPAKIEVIARAAGAAAPGAQLAQQVKSDLAALARERQRITKRVRALFVLNVQSGRLTVGGRESGADGIMTLAGLDNAADQIKGYKPIGDEALLTMQPDLIIVMRAVDGHDSGQIKAIAAVAATPAGRDNRIVSVDGANLLSFGPRVATEARELMYQAYPALRGGQ